MRNFVKTLLLQIVQNLTCPRQSHFDHLPQYHKETVSLSCSKSKKKSRPLKVKCSEMQASRILSDKKASISDSSTSYRLGQKNYI